MNLLCSKLRKPFETKKVIKLITGIDNLDISNILSMTKSAELSGVTYIDTIASTRVVKLLKSFSSLPICVSSIDPVELFNCVTVGVDLIEIGNFAFCYKQGIYLTAWEILKLAKEIRSLASNIDICVTIPYYLPLDKQINLAQDLECIGINILQTESIFIKNRVSVPNLLHNNLFNFFDSSCLSLLSCYIISKHVSLPILASSSMNNFSSCLSLSMSASGIGIGSTVNTYGDIPQMSCYLRSLRYLIDSVNVNPSFKVRNALEELSYNLEDFYTTNSVII
uniref:Uncharacterized protein ycf23 n=1 Tax=Chondria sp. (in: red algae) TaxID=1982705 RepID=A0A1Z1MEC3_9FLOR|nr:hypothetical protein [Chondria sp. (in: red algae)]